MKHTFEKLGTEVGALVDQKQAAYGDSFGRSGDFLRLVYPNGVQPEQLDDLLPVARIFDKLARIATGNDQHGESPYQDIAGYGLLGMQLANQRVKERKHHQCPGNASDQDARNQSEAQPASAAESTSSPTTTNANATDANEPSQPHASCLPDPVNVDVSTAPAPASVVEAVRLGRQRNELGECAWCRRNWPSLNTWIDTWRYSGHSWQLVFCQKGCADSARQEWPKL